MTTNKVRVRYPPSPTGYFHAGGARTALFNWLFARRHGGVFVLRIEDTDRSRYVPAALQDLLDGLRWLGLDWDEGPEVGGPYAPYFQSERLPIYQEYAQKLVAEGQAYKCYCSTERLEAMREEQRRRKQPPGYDRRCRNLTRKEIADYEAQGIVPVIRLKVPLEGETSFYDRIHGLITMRNDQMDDLVLLKSDGYPTYHLANVVDDHLMEITHIMRGHEWIPSTPRHVVLYRAFGWTPPEYAHLPVVLNPSGKGKMSKRKTIGEDGREYVVLLHDFRDLGYLPEAMFNFLALLGWSYDDKTEVMSREEIIARFDLDRVSKSPAAFSYDKLDWMNGLYIRNLAPDDLTDRLMPFLRKAGLDADREMLRRITPLIQERLKRLSDAVVMVDFFFSESIEYNPARLVEKDMTKEDALRVLRAAREALKGLPCFDEATVERALRPLVEQLGMKARQVFGTIRVATTGKEVSPPLFGTLSILGKERTLRRLEQAETRLLEI